MPPFRTIHDDDGDDNNGDNDDDGGGDIGRCTAVRRRQRFCCTANQDVFSWHSSLLLDLTICSCRVFEFLCVQQL